MGRLGPLAQRLKREAELDGGPADRAILAELAKGPATPGALMSVVCQAMPHAPYAGSLAIQRMEVLRRLGHVASAQDTLGSLMLVDAP